MSNPVSSVAGPIASVGFGVARVPVDLLAKLTGNGDNREWGPVLAFDRVEAGVRQVLGSLLGDPELARQGDVEDVRVRRRSEAVERDQAAGAEREAADDRFRDRRERDQKAREQAREQEQKQKQKLEQERKKREDDAERREQRRKEQAAQDEQRAHERIDEHAHEARRTRVESESEAVEAERAAAERKAEALELAEAAETARKRR